MTKLARAVTSRGVAEIPSRDHFRASIGKLVAADSGFVAFRVGVDIFKRENGYTLRNVLDTRWSATRRQEQQNRQ